MTELIPIKLHKFTQSRVHTAIILGTETKKFTIYTEPQVGKDLQIYLLNEKKPRPSSHDLIQRILDGYGITPLQVVIYEVHDTVYFAKLFLETEKDGKKTILELDARPSDCILLSVLQKIPLYCKKEVLDKASNFEE